MRIKSLLRRLIPRRIQTIFRRLTPNRLPSSAPAQPDTVDNAERPSGMSLKVNFDVISPQLLPSMATVETDMDQSDYHVIHLLVHLNLATNKAFEYRFITPLLPFPDNAPSMKANLLRNIAHELMSAVQGAPCPLNLNTVPKLTGQFILSYLPGSATEVNNASEQRTQGQSTDYTRKIVTDETAEEALAALRDGRCHRHLEVELLLISVHEEGS